MKYTLMFLLSAVLLAAAEEKKEAACKPKDVVCNQIAATRQLLADYQKEIRKQIDTTQRAYTSIARAADQGRRDEIELVLMDQRNRRSEQLADAFVNRVRPVWQYKEHLLEYAVQDFQTNRELLELESAGGTRFVEGLLNLEVEFGKAQALDGLLAALNEKKSLLGQAQELGSFGQQAKDEFDKLVCAGLKADLTAKNASIKAADAEIKALEAKPQSAERDQALALKRIERNAAAAAVTKLSKQRENKGCKD
jgi:hypothetical protein